MPIILTSSIVVCGGSSSRAGGPAAGDCLRSSLPATNSFDNNVVHWRTQKSTAVDPCDAASSNCVVSSDDGQQLHHGREQPPRGVRCGSGCPTISSHGSSTKNRMSTLNCADTGSTLQTRFPSTIALDRQGDILAAYTKSGIPGSGGFRLLMSSFLGGRLHRPQRKTRGLAIRCSITGPVPDDCSPTDTATTAVTGGDVSNKHSSVVNEADETGRDPVKAAFFDVDGTITRTNVVFAYLFVRMAELKFIKKLLWVPWFALSCIVYLIVDHFHRPTFNRMFYSSYKGRPTEGKTSMANLVFEQYYKPRIMAKAAEHILELKRLGYLIVLVTGALDFQIEPLAQELGADHLYAAKLIEKNGRFTGGLQGMACSNREKAERIWEYAKRHGVSLRDSLAFGDSIADIPMLEVVGKPYAVNPDARLQAIALKRGWAILNWKVNAQKTAASIWGILKWRIYKKNEATTLSA